MALLLVLLHFVIDKVISFSFDVVFFRIQHQNYLEFFQISKSYNKCMKKNKKLVLLSGSICLVLGIVAFWKGYNSDQQWRQSFAIVGFVIMLAIFATSVIIAFKQKY